MVFKTQMKFIASCFFPGDIFAVTQQTKLTLPIGFELSQVRVNHGDNSTEIGCMTDVVTDESVRTLTQPN